MLVVGSFKKKNNEEAKPREWRREGKETRVLKEDYFSELHTRPTPDDIQKGTELTDTLSRNRDEGAA